MPLPADGPLAGGLSAGFLLQACPWLVERVGGFWGWTMGIAVWATEFWFRRFVPRPLDAFLR